ncbi:MAG: hypothetical protein IIV06_08500 [Alistipes sp.]|nr:hypothetical protein [Alistipes sp.]
MHTAEYDGLPLFKATFPEESDGIIRVSLVDMPAVQSDFMFFSAAKKPQLYSVANEEKRLVRGVILRADYPIYRFEYGHEFYITFEKEEIKKLAERYLYDGRQNRVNLQHERNSDVAGVHLRQLFIKDTEAGVNPVGFEDIEDGSLFGEYHIINDEVWAAIKEGTYKGFSVEIMGCAEADVEEFCKTTKNQSNMSLKSMFKKLLVNFAAVNTDKGVLAWDGEAELAVGDAVFIEEDGERKDAPEGDYTTEEGKIIKVAEGKVAEIIDPEEDVAEEQPEAEQMAEETPEEGAGDNELAAIVADLVARVEALEAELAASKEFAEQMKAEFEAFAKTPAADPAHQEFAEQSIPTTNNKAAQIAAALRKK